MTTDTDDWVARLCTEDSRDTALAELRGILLRGLTAASRNRYGGRLATEDIVQIALMKILDKIDTFEGRSKFTTWAMTITMRLAISEMRRKHFSDVSMSALAKENLEVDLAVVNDSPIEIESEKGVILRKLKELIETDLTPKQRVAMNSLLTGMPVEVIAEKSGSCLLYTSDAADE